jgi:hypothetical protein
MFIKRSKKSMLENIKFLKRRFDETEAIIKAGESPFRSFSDLMFYIKEFQMSLVEVKKNEINR